MDRQKMIQQAKVLRDKKVARMAKLGKQLRPQVEAGVVKHTAPVAKPLRKVQQFAAPSLPVRAARKVAPKAPTPQQQDMRQQSVNPKKIVRKQKGCSGCRRKTR